MNRRAVFMSWKTNSSPKSLTQQLATPFLMVNQVGANTEVVFHGDSLVHDKSGDLVLCAPSFDESLLVWDSDSTEIAIAVPSIENRPVRDIHDALVTGIRDYFRKTGAFSEVIR